MLHIKQIKITPEILRLAAGIDEFKGRWNALETHTTALQMVGEVASFNKNLQAMLGPLKDIPLDEKLICKLQNVLSAQSGAASYRTENFPLVVQNGNQIIGSLDSAQPEDIANLMGKLMEWLNKAMDEEQLHPLLLTGLFMAVFLQIFPFEKGNQKLARFLVLLLLLKQGYDYVPYATLDDVLNARAQDYFDAMKITQDSLEAGTLDWSAWLIFFLGAMAEQKNKLAQRLEIKGRDLSNLPTLSGKIMKLFEKNKRMQMKEIVKATKGKRSTIKLRLNELVDGGYLRRHGQARSTWYSLV